ncbi:DUF3465 domain-containing protein [Gallaecimonas sp. GXIMD4217]|uniref:DUF3465 domain-containing protein n=1 Tax=Gallaecimonas sp. GXIMD4217 TaxID=3131927 RepID=UPI00311B0170
MKKLVIAIVCGLALFAFYQHNPVLRGPTPQQAAANDQLLADAFQHRRSDLQVRGEGTVVRILPDDNDGSRHQKFILRLASGQTLLVAHNIDLAPRIPNLREGDKVAFSGEYEWNAKGGVIHWTHHDPQGRHTDGWLKHDGHFYQ